MIVHMIVSVVRKEVVNGLRSGSQKALPPEAHRAAAKLPADNLEDIREVFGQAVKRYRHITHPENNPCSGASLDVRGQTTSVNYSTRDVNYQNMDALVELMVFPHPIYVFTKNIRRS